ncbi:hypothetical protein O6H91_03G078700 [Diphasiastrum complanatum]|uniref:Uncharacterized protein n=1 Tax=Diphasiastrum complanatum TaxID=34168 RepID=A0ACC2E842_DIPCM|nr:hypothetical protein O6H91_03G078700 [Diphasiastrum complanatum]
MASYIRRRLNFDMSWSALALLLLLDQSNGHKAQFSVEEATIDEIQAAFKAGTLTSRQLVESYLHRIATFNPLLHAIIEVNPDALTLADKADEERKIAKKPLSPLHGIPILLKDNIATKDKLNTTAGSFALLGSVVPRDAGVVRRLRKAGAIIIGKANLSEWANFKSTNSSNGYSSRGGQTLDPYVLGADPCGSSSGSAVSPAANLVAVSLGTETDASIICPASRNAVVGIKPTVGLTSRAGVVPISHTQDTVGPLCRTVSDAVEVLDVIVGFDKLDRATRLAARFIPKGGYKQFLKKDGLKGKRIGIIRDPFFTTAQNPLEETLAIDELLPIMRKVGAELIDNATIKNVAEILVGNSETTVLLFDFKHDINKYLASLIKSPVRTLADIIAFDIKHANEELNKSGQELFLLAESTTGLQSMVYKTALETDHNLTSHGIDKLIKSSKLDAILAPSFSGITSVAAIRGYPGISVPAGFDKGVPFGITFVGKRGSEPTLIEIAYSFEQATKIRKPPKLFSKG